MKHRVNAYTNRASFRLNITYCVSAIVFYTKKQLFLAVHLYNKAVYIIYIYFFEAGGPHVDRRHYWVLSPRLPVTPKVLSARKMSESRPRAQMNCCIRTQVHYPARARRNARERCGEVIPYDSLK